MKINVIDNTNIAVVETSDVIIFDVQSILDLIANVRYTTNCDKIIINKDNIVEEFFDLSTKLAGEILQKIINYKFKIGIVGDFSKYTSKSLKDFIYECNNGNDIFLVPTKEIAVDKLKKL
ncbi:MAG: DUF4180 domain-containing protein [Clostridia bacterium]|nr:DUF4180 domain-containing protein [Clostridia bacterium]